MRTAWLEGVKPVAGSARLILSRWLLWIVTALPGVMAGIAGIGEGAGRQPYFTEAPRPFPLIELFRFLGRLPGGMWGLLFAGAALAWLGNLMLTAGAVEILRARSGDRVRVWRAAFDAGAARLLPYLRVAVLALLWLVILGALVDQGFDRLRDHARLAGWTGKAAVWDLRAARLGLLLLLGSTVGAGAMWCRVIVAADGRRHVRRLNTLVPRLWLRRPLQGLVLQVLLALASLLVGALVLFGWRQSGAGATWPWVAVWLIVLLAQSWVWHWRLRICCLIWDDPGLDRLRSTPDEPWHVFRKLSRLARRKRRPPPEPAPTLGSERSDYST